MADAVLDSSAVLAWIDLEPGWSDIQSILKTSLLSTVNLSEVVAKLAERGGTDDIIQQTLALLPCQLIGFDAAQAMTAGVLRSTTKHAGLSFGDRACLALAAARKLPVWTADRAWAKVDVGVDVRLIR